jgi:hypothetical protein
MIAETGGMSVRLGICRSGAVGFIADKAQVQMEGSKSHKEAVDFAVIRIRIEAGYS